MQDATPSDSLEDMPIVKSLKAGRQTLFWSGIIMVVLGVIALAYPQFSTLTVNFMIGWILIFAGIAFFIGAFSIHGAGPFFGALLTSLITLGAGIFLISNPGMGILALTMALAIVFMVKGAFQIALAFDMRPLEGWGWMLAAGILAIILGIMIASRLPGASLVVLGVILGVDLISSGVASVMVANKVKNLTS